MDKNVDGDIPLSSPAPAAYNVKFKTTNLKSVISNIDADDIMISPMYQDTEEGEVVVGVCIWTDNMEVVIGGVEE